MQQDAGASEVRATQSALLMHPLVPALRACGHLPETPSPLTWLWRWASPEATRSSQSHIDTGSQLRTALW